jgi:F-type H+-transporting ATPase subunit delta
MDQGLLPRRYAKALYKLAVERNCDAEMYGYMQRIVSAYAASPALQQTIANPFVDAATKTQLLQSAAGTGTDTSATLADFIKLLVNNRRIDLARLIALAYLQIYRNANNIYSVEIVSAAQLSDADAKRLRALIDRHLNGATAEYSYTINPDLIGGFVVNIDSERLDASVKNELEQLRLNLLK